MVRFLYPLPNFIIMSVQEFRLDSYTCNNFLGYKFSVVRLWPMGCKMLVGYIYMLVSFLVSAVLQPSLVTAAVLQRSSIFLVAKVVLLAGGDHALLPVPALQSTCHWLTNNQQGTFEVTMCPLKPISSYPIIEHLSWARVYPTWSERIGGGGG